MQVEILMKGTQIKVKKNGVWVPHILRENIDTSTLVDRTTEVIAPMKLVTVATYKGFKIQYRSSDCLVRKTKLAGNGECRKCGGSGYIPGFQHVQGGKCFSCRPVGNTF